MAKPYDFALFPTATMLDSDDVADGNHDFPLSGGVDAPLGNILSYFYFVDSGGVIAVPTVGTVKVLGSTDGGITYLSLNGGSDAKGGFDAADALDPDLTRVTGLAQLTHVRVTLTGVDVADHFVSKFIQTQGI